MKRIIFTIGLILSLTAVVVYADLTTTLDTTWTEKDQRESAFKARATLEEMTIVVREGLLELQEIKDSGKFDTLPTDLKVALNTWWQIYKDAKSAFQADANVVELFNWRP